MYRLCYFCKVKYEFAEVKRDGQDHLSPICYSCNKKGVHLKNDWIIKVNDDCIYDFMKDAFVKSDGTEISRLMYNELRRSL